MEKKPTCIDCEQVLKQGRIANLEWIHDAKIEDIAGRCVACQERYEAIHGRPAPRINRESMAALSEVDDCKAAREAGWKSDDMAPVVIPTEAA